MIYRILVINPGAGSTRIAVFENELLLFEENIRHPSEQLLQFPKIIDQYDYRRKAILDFLQTRNFDLQTLQAVVGRGGPFKPLVSGTYQVNDLLINDIKTGNYQSEHPSLLGVLIAKEIADQIGKNAYFVDPVSVDEFWELSRFSGLREIKRKALSHALNVRMVAKKAAGELKKPYENCNFVIIHLGTGITVAAHLQGKQVDSSNANEDGPFSPQRSGVLPTMPLVKLCFSGQYTADDIKKKLNREGGMLSYLGTDDIQAIESRIDKGDQEAELAYKAMIYQIAKETGAYSIVLKGQIDAIIITGGIANSAQFVNKLKEWIGFLCSRFFVYPGEGEMEGLACGVLRILNQEELVKSYT
ncbi:butyrate kinase [candidate division WOR-3 bacterium RBG_13_43_14]|uniref:Probable butyrate kinase n=1 Tax=candidate division WOR-3 bacterium RBG_13_43_14 TaxID=1802590 RepID=A0A1F4UG19_UNCW3|nr:MAG: butyrate kinase [candidate division WOR-3 bacterium RBG_13_43_14]